MVIRSDSATQDPWGTNTATASVRYARWAGLSSLTGQPTLIDLSGAFTTGDVTLGYYQAAEQGSNDYHMMTTSDCYVWCAYVKPHALPDQTQKKPHVFVRLITITSICNTAAAIADFNHDAAVNVADLSAFGSAFLAASASADIDGNQAVALSDSVQYMQAYTAAGGTQP